MAYSSITYTGDGATTQFAVPFNYIRKEHVKVEVNQVNQAYTWVTNSIISVSPAPANATQVTVFRDTPITAPLVDFTDGSTPVAIDFDTSNLQHLYIEQELDDKVDTGIVALPDGTLDAGSRRLRNILDPTAAQDAATKNYVDTRDALKVSKAGDSMTGQLDMGSQRIVNMADPVNAQDAATKNWVETAGASPLVQFRGIYYGVYSVDPIVDPYGNARNQGDLYFNGISKLMRVFDGTAWVDATANASVRRYRFVAVGGETVVSGADANGETLGYSPGVEQVYLNGVLLARAVDYTAIDGTSIADLAALAASDVLEVIAFSQVVIIPEPQIDGGFANANFGGTINYINGGNA